MKQATLAECLAISKRKAPETVLKAAFDALAAENEQLKAEVEKLSKPKTRKRI